jgi:hypothetical protein
VFSVERADPAAYFWQLQAGLPYTIDVEAGRIGLDRQGGATAASIACSCPPVDQLPPTVPQPTSPQVTSQLGSQLGAQVGSHDCSQVGSQQLEPPPKRRLRMQPRLRHIRSHGKLMPLPQQGR